LIAITRDAQRMSTIILGSAGQLGRELLDILPGAIGLTRADADFTDITTTRAVIAPHRPRLVINCAAYNLVDRAETEPAAAMATNAWAVRDLAKLCAELDAKFVHISTDYVFGLDTTRATPYAETDAPGPVSVYGLSKLAGEYFVQAAHPGHLVVRTCGLYGHRGAGGRAWGSLASGSVRDPRRRLPGGRSWRRTRASYTNPHSRREPDPWRLRESTRRSFAPHRWPRWAY
jgi:dTDP-4-dehydrorhamnose reductase